MRWSSMIFNVKIFGTNSIDEFFFVKAMKMGVVGPTSLTILDALCKVPIWGYGRSDVRWSFFND